jgi:hypothetical protein
MTIHLRRYCGPKNGSRSTVTATLPAASANRQHPYSSFQQHRPVFTLNQSIQSNPTDRSTTHQVIRLSHKQQCPASSPSPAARSSHPPATPSSSPSPPPSPSAPQFQETPAARPRARTPTRHTPPAKRTSWMCSLPTARRRESK